MRPYRPLCLLPLAALAACTVGPNFERPATPAAKTYLAAGETAGRAATDGVVPVRWWTAYGSLALDALVDKAIAQNPTIDASNATLASARSALAAARGRALPQVNANARAEREQVNLAGFGFGGGAIPGFPTENPEFNLYSVGGGVSYDLDLFGGRRRGIEQAAAQAEAQLRQAEAAHLTLAGQVVTQAITLAAVRARIATVTDLICEDQRNVDLTDKRRRGGEGTMVQVLSARSQLAADQALLPPLRQALSEARHMLAILVGEAPSDFEAPDFDLATLALPGTIPVSLPSELVHRRPDILQAEAELHAATAAIGVATARLYPDITLGATLEQGAPSAGNLLKNAFRGYDVFAGLTAPIFNGGALKAGQQGAEAEARAANARYQEVVLKAFGQVADLLTALDHDAEAVRTQQEAIDVAGAALALSRRSFEVGNSGVLDIVDAERVHQRALTGLVEARARQYLDTARLFVATAGGWTGPASQ